MKKLHCLALLAFFMFSCGEPPLQFSEAVLNEEFTAFNNESVLLSDILKKHEGKTILIDVWASWCSDCIKGMPALKALQNEFKDIEYVFLSVDRNEAAWKHGIEKHNMEGDHYFIPSGQKGAFGDFMNSNWIPRYMVIDETSKIKLFKAKRATDVRIKEALQ